MTRLPTESWDVRGVDGPKLKVGPKCAAPFCDRYADHSHHLWRRSFLAGDYSWVELSFLPDKPVVANLVGLCYRCHQEITENRAVITYADGGFVWTDDAFTGPLSEQRVADSTPVAPDACPTCGKRKRTEKADLPPGEKRRRKSWNLTVPDDAEDGAEVLDTLCEELSERFGHDEYKSTLRRYYTVAQAFALLLQHTHLITEE